MNESDNYPRSPSVVLSGNGYKYHKKVLQSSFYRPKLQPYYLYNFREIQRNSNEFEAWMLVAGGKRESFDYSLFLRDFRARKYTSLETEKLSTYKSSKNLILRGNMFRMMALLIRSQTMCYEQLSH